MTTTEPGRNQSREPAAATGRQLRWAWLAGLTIDITPLRRSPGFRELYLGQTLSTLGSQLTVVALPVQVYARTDSTFAVGLIGLVQLVPLLVVGVLGVTILDTVDRRRLVLITSSVLAASSALLAASTATGWAAVWPLYLLAGVQAAAGSLDMPARAVFLPIVLPVELIPAAGALDQLRIGISFTIGSLLAGVLIAGPGFATAYVFDAFTFLTALYGVWRLPRIGAQRGAPQPGLAAFVEGLRWVWHHPILLATFGLSLSSLVFGLPRALFPALVSTQFHAGPEAVGAFYAAPALGAIIIAALSGPLVRLCRHGAALLVATAAYGGAIALFGLSDHLGLAFTLLVIAGAATAVSRIYRATVLLGAAPEHIRGRVQGLSFVTISAGVRLGDLESGAAAALTNPTIAAWSGGLLCLLATIVITFTLPEIRRLTSSDYSRHEK